MQGFPTRSYLYNYATALRTNDPRVFLVEGPPDVWGLAEAGRAATEKLRGESLRFRCNCFPVGGPYKDFGVTPASALAEAIARFHPE